MGTNVAPLLANLSLGVLEIFNQLGYEAITQWLDWDYPPTIWMIQNPFRDGFLAARYIDDLIVGSSSNNSKKVLECVREDYVLAYLNLVYGTSTDTTVVYLDTEILKVTSDQRIEYSLYSKPGTRHDYHPIGSYIHNNVPTGIIIGGFKRIQNLTMTVEDRHEKVKYLIKKLLIRGYTPTKILQTIKNYEDNNMMINKT